LMQKLYTKEVPSLKISFFHHDMKKETFQLASDK
jgi:hypothetical protein